MKKKLLIVNREQYGYHVDTYKYCEYLKDTFDTTYIGWERDEYKKIKTGGIITQYISRRGNIITRYLRFLMEVNKAIRQTNYDVIFLVYFPGVSIIRLLNTNKTLVVDIRSCTISFSKLTSTLCDFLIRLECSIFPNITIVSQSLAKALKLKQYHLLPLGGETFSEKKKDFTNLNLLYVGTLHGRNIIQCVKGFHQYLKKLDGEQTNVSFTIVGDAYGSEKKEISQYVKDNNLSQFVRVEGYVHNSLLHKYFEDANVGVSYIPMTKYFDNQPPTKTYEYLLSGLPVIATMTKENKTILYDGCGILIRDNIEDFARSISELYKSKNTYDSKKIRNQYEKSLWKNIVKNNLEPYFLSLIQKQRLSKNFLVSY